MRSVGSAPHRFRTHSSDSCEERTVGKIGRRNVRVEISSVPEYWKTFGANHGILISTLAWYEGLRPGQLTGSHATR